jgi:hypothetical protein
VAEKLGGDCFLKQLESLFAPRNALCRRGFHEALAETKLAAWFVRQIGLFYSVEKKLREQKAGPALRQAMRAWESQPVLTRLHRAMELVRRKTLPQGLLGQAIDYALKRWEALTRFVEDGVLEIDSNLIENSIRPSALGKRNWLFVGHPEAGERSAVIYTLLGSCRRHGINPFDYLKDFHSPARRQDHPDQDVHASGVGQGRRLETADGSACVSGLSTGKISQSVSSSRPRPSGDHHHISGCDRARSNQQSCTLSGPNARNK